MSSCRCSSQEDPWELVEWGRDFQKFDCVEDFISLPGVGHCPMDEAPELVNPLLQEFVLKHQERSTELEQRVAADAAVAP